MEKIANSRPFRMPICTIDSALNKYSNVVRFPEKLKQANEILSLLSDEDKKLLGYVDISTESNEEGNTVEQTDLEQPQVQEALAV